MNKNYKARKITKAYSQWQKVKLPLNSPEPSAGIRGLAGESRLK